MPKQLLAKTTEMCSGNTTKICFSMYKSGVNIFNFFLVLREANFIRKHGASIDFSENDSFYRFLIILYLNYNPISSKYR